MEWKAEYNSIPVAAATTRLKETLSSRCLYCKGRNYRICHLTLHLKKLGKKANETKTSKTKKKIKSKKQWNCKEEKQKANQWGKAVL